MPEGQLARDLYEAMESARVEAVGAERMPGTAGNIDARIGAEARRKRLCPDPRQGRGGRSPPPRANLKSATSPPAATCPEGASNVMGALGAASSREKLRRERLGGLSLDGGLGLQRPAGLRPHGAQADLRNMGYGDQLGDDPDLPDEDETRPPKARTRTTAPTTPAKTNGDESEDMDASP